MVSIDGEVARAIGRQTKLSMHRGRREQRINAVREDFDAIIVGVGGGQG
jgi:riboflavin biosynthesis pyrimidine reductase